MAKMAVAAMLLIGAIIYSLSQLQTPVWTTSLREVKIEATLSNPMPQFEFSENGHSLRSTDFTGRWTLLTFWATWCGPCINEMPTLNKLIQSWPGREFSIMTINTDENDSNQLEQARQFLADNEITLPTTFDTKKIISQAFKVKELPRHFLINPEGKIVWEEIGAFDWSTNHARDQLVHAMGDQAFSETGTPDDSTTSLPETDSESGPPSEE